MAERRVYIAELAEIVNRRRQTIRGWEEKLPSEHLPARDSPTGWRYWTEEQVDGIKEWMIGNCMSPGSGLGIPAEREEAMLGILRGRAA